MKKALLKALKGEVVTPPPFWLMRQAGRYLPEYRALRAGAGSFLEFCYTSDLAVEASLQPIRRYGMDAAILFSDILVVPDALGQRVAFVEGEGPVLEPVRSEADIARLCLESLEDRLAPVFEAVRCLKGELTGETALIGFAGAPWTVAVYMVEGRGGSDGGLVRRWAYTAPETFGRLIDLLVEATARHLGEQVRCGAEALQIFDSWAGILSESQFRRWVIEPTAALVRRVKADYPGVPVIGFPRGAGLLYEDYAAATGVDGVSLDSAVPIGWAGAKLQARATVQGNLDNQALVVGGAVLAAETRRICERLASGPFIFNLGHGVLPETPPEHVAELAALIKAWGRS